MERTTTSISVILVIKNSGLKRVREVMHMLKKRILFLFMRMDCIIS